MAYQKILDNVDDLVRFIDQFEYKHRPFLIGIDGRPCSGKSTLADQLTEAMNADSLFLDDFFIPQEHWPKGIKPGFPFPYFRYEEFIQNVRLLSEGQGIIYYPYDWAQKTLGKAKAIVPKNIVIIEGVSALSLELVPLLNIRIFVVSNQKDELLAISNRENKQSLILWQKLYLPSVNIYWQTKPWERADILYAGRGIANKHAIHVVLAHE